MNEILKKHIQMVSTKHADCNKNKEELAIFIRQFEQLLTELDSIITNCKVTGVDSGRLYLIYQHFDSLTRSGQAVGAGIMAEMTAIVTKILQRRLTQHFWLVDEQLEFVIAIFYLFKFKAFYFLNNTQAYQLDFSLLLLIGTRLEQQQPIASACRELIRYLAYQLQHPDDITGLEIGDQVTIVIDNQPENLEIDPVLQQGDLPADRLQLMQMIHILPDPMSLLYLKHILTISSSIEPLLNRIYAKNSTCNFAKPKIADYDAELMHDDLAYLTDGNFAQPIACYPSFNQFAQQDRQTFLDLQPVIPVLVTTASPPDTYLSRLLNKIFECLVLDQGKPVYDYVDVDIPLACLKPRLFSCDQKLGQTFNLPLNSLQHQNHQIEITPMTTYIETQHKPIENRHDTQRTCLRQCSCQTALADNYTNRQYIPFATIIPRLQHVAHQTALLFNRPVELLFEPTVLQLDPVIITHIATALEPMLRNAIDHGIEDANQRLAQNKTPSGRIVLRVTSDEHEIVVSLTDDGQGIDRRKLCKKAHAMGLINGSDDLDDQQILQLIFSPGLTTAQVPPAMSGRGMGLELAQYHIQALGGEINVTSNLGHGTTFTLRIHRSRLIDDVLIFRLGQQQYALALSDIHAVVRLSSWTLAAYFKDNEEQFEIAGTDYKLRYLSELMDHQAIPDLKTNTMQPVILLKHMTGESVALLVDQLITSCHQVIVQPVKSQDFSSNIIATGRRLTDGQTCFILDSSAIVGQIGILNSAQSERC